MVFLADGGVGESLGHECQDVALAGTEVVERITLRIRRWSRTRREVLEDERGLSAERVEELLIVARQLHGTAR